MRKATGRYCTYSSATTPEHVSYSWGRNVENESLRMEDGGTLKEQNTNSQDSNIPIDHGHLAQNCLIKIHSKLQYTKCTKMFLKN